MSYPKYFTRIYILSRYIEHWYLLSIKIALTVLHIIHGSYNTSEPSFWIKEWRNQVEILV